MKMWRKDPTISTDMIREYDEGETYCWFYYNQSLYNL